MPYLKVETNAAVEETRRAAFLEEASRQVSGLLGKDEQYFMGAVTTVPDMTFGGSSTPLAYVELKALGLPDEKAGDLCTMLSALVKEQLAVPEDRIYITFQNIDRGRWGWPARAGCR